MFTLPELRKAQNISQRGLSQKTKIPASTIAAYELGTRIPSLERAKVLAKFFNKKVEEIYFGLNSDQQNTGTEG